MGKRWSRKHERCLSCSTSAAPHRAKGLCGTCYDRQIAARLRSRRQPNATAALTREFLEREYGQMGKSTTEIGSSLGCSRQTVYQRLRTLGIPTRNYVEARKHALEQGRVPNLRLTRVNETFFEVWRPSMAYVLGLAATDGHLDPPRVDSRTGHSRAVGFTLTQKDPRLLEQVRHLMGSDATIHSRRGRSGTTVHYLRYSNRRIYDALVRHGLTPRKSLTLEFPDVPEEMLRHFVRGCWDGDGSVYLRRGAALPLAASFVSGSESFIRAMADQLRRNGLQPSPVYTSTSRAGSPSYLIRLLGKAAEELGRFLYEGVGPELRLERKYRIFAPYLWPSAAGLPAGTPPNATASQESPDSR